MKHKTKLRRGRAPGAARLPGVTVPGLGFALGALAGCLWAGWVPAAESGALASYLKDCLEAVRAGQTLTAEWSALLWQSARWPLWTALLSLTAAGLVGIPVLFGVRGFLLSFAVACFVRVLGGEGALLAAALFGVNGLFALPVLFLLGEQGMAASRALAERLLGEGRGRPVYSRAYALSCAVCGGVLLVGAAVEQRTVPVLMRVLSGVLG